MLLEKRRKSTFFWLIVSRKYCTLSQPKDMFKRMQQATNNKHSVFISDLKNPLLFKFFVVVFLLQDLGGSTKKNYRFFFLFLLFGNRSQFPIFKFLWWKVAWYWLFFLYKFECKCLKEKFSTWKNSLKSEYVFFFCVGSAGRLDVFFTPELTTSKSITKL